METQTFAVIALVIMGFALVSRRVQSTVLTPPLIFTALGLLLAQHGLEILHLDVGDAVIHTLAELTLVMVLFTDASRIDLRRLRREHDIPVRLLAFGMPLTLGLGALVATFLFPSFTFWEAALLAAILTPTDAALGQAVVSSKKVPVRIRQALNVESGLNDGIALPAVLILMSTCEALGGHGEGGAGYWLQFAFLQVTLGPLVGIAVGYLGARAVEWGVRSGWMSEAFEELSAIGLALLAFAGAELVHGNGFIAAFVAGLVLGNTLRERCQPLYEFAEAEGQLLTLLVFLIFGGVMLPEAWPEVGWMGWVYGALSLTVIRILPVALSLLRKKLRRETVLFLGWFGPRGVASILFALLVVENSNLPERHAIMAIVMATVAMSIVAHGLTAVPGANAYSRRMKEAEGSEEHAVVEEMPVRVRHGGETEPSKP